MTRLSSWLVVTGVIAASGGSAYAETQAEIAARENDEGRDLMYASKYDEATAKFRDAVARVPESKYFFNLCTSLYQEGKYGDALTACNSAAQNGPDDKLKDKIDKMSGRIKDEAQKQGLDIQPVGGGGGDPNTPVPNGQTPDPNADPNANPNPNPSDTGQQPPPNGQQPPPNGQQPPPNGQMPPPRPVVQYRSAVGRPPPDQAVFVGVRPDHSYTWTIGVDLFGGGGSIGDNGFYGGAVGGVRIKSDFLFNRANRVGVQFYLQFSGVNSGDQMVNPVNSLTIIDVGAALYKHWCLRGNEHVCLTGLAGLGLAAFNPSGLMDSSGDGSLTLYPALNVRGELAASYAFGPRLENVLSVQGGVNYYSGAGDSSDSGAPSAAQVGLDTGGGFGYVGIGFTRRFNTPLGAHALVTLE